MSWLDREADKLEKRARKLQQQIEEALVKGDIAKARALTQELRMIAATETAIGEALMKLADELEKKKGVQQ